MRWAVIVGVLSASLAGRVAAQPLAVPYSLQAAISEAQARNPQLLAAERAVVVAQTGLTIAGVTPNPRLSADVPFGEAETKRTVSFEQPFELGGKRNARLAVAQDQVRVTQGQLDLLRWQIRTDVSQIYAELAIAEAAQAQVQRSINLSQQLVRIAQKRLAAGDVAEAEVIQAQFALERVRQRLEPATNRIRQANTRLGTLLGQRVSAPIDATDRNTFNLSVEKQQPLPKLRKLPELPELQTLARQKRLDLLLAQQQIQLSLDLIALAQVAKIPDLGLAGGFIWDPVSATTAATLGLRIDVPIFNTRQGELDQALATQTLAQAQKNALERQVDGEVSLAYQDVITAQTLLERDRRILLPQAEQVLNLAQKSYQAGQSSFTDVLVTQQAVQDQRDAFYSDLTAYQTARNGLERAINQPLVELTNAP